MVFDKQKVLSNWSTHIESASELIKKSKKNKYGTMGWFSNTERELKEAFELGTQLSGFSFGRLSWIGSESKPYTGDFQRCLYRNSYFQSYSFFYPYLEEFSESKIESFREDFVLDAELLNLPEKGDCGWFSSSLNELREIVETGNIFFTHFGKVDYNFDDPNYVFEMELIDEPPYRYEITPFREPERYRYFYKSNK